jgi:DNA-binding response OmpR family regulator
LSRDPRSRPKRDNPLVVLIVPFEPDDSPLAGALSASGCQIAFCQDGESGYDAICSLGPDCVLCDDDLPDTDGDAVARRLRKLEFPVGATPFVLLASPTAARNRVAHFATGADVCIVKPYRAQEVVAQALALVHMTERLRAAREARSTMSPRRVTAFEGDVQHISIGAILTIVDLERRTGCFRHDSQGRRAEIDLVGGQVVRGRLLGQPIEPLLAIRAMVSWNEGRFSFTANPGGPIEGKARRLSEVLAEATRLEDEANRPDA